MIGREWVGRVSDWERVVGESEWERVVGESE